MSRLTDIDEVISDRLNLDWQKGYEEGLSVGISNERNRIIKLFEDRLAQAKSFEGDITAMQVIVDVEVLEVIVHAMIHAINQEQDEQDN